MPRDVTGTYNLPGTVNPVITGTAITANWANTTLDDIAEALTESASTDGSSQYTGPIKAWNGTSSTPSYAWALEANTGWYRAAAAKIAFVVGSAVKWVYQATKTQVNQNLDFVKQSGWPGTASAHVGLRIAPDDATDGTPMYAFIGETWYTTPGAATHTTTPGTRLIEIMAVGGGGGSGALPSTTSTQITATGGGGGGEFVRHFLVGTQVEATYTLSVGAAGTGGTGGGTGGNGGASTVTGGTSTTLRVRAYGGVGSAAGTITDTRSTTPPIEVAGGGGGTGGTGSIKVAGGTGMPGFKQVTSATADGSIPRSGAGGRSAWPFASFGILSGGAGNGGSGQWSHINTSATDGFAGTAGAIIIREWA